mmetsp:Transcript_70693/g.122395  ORF Transcript_70693/g.122395 Transcript_70693/m.122395 type:complete len:414 (-) Transcript_70693:106-1347(-)
MAFPAVEDFLTPMKVELSSTPQAGIKTARPEPSLKDVALPNLALATSFTSGEWATVVHSVAPYLSAQGLRRALAILDQATQNVQRLKALDEVIRSTHEAESFGNMNYASLPYAQCALTCLALQDQLREQQLRLLVELQQLPCDTRSVRRDVFQALAASMPASPCLLPPHLISSLHSATTTSPAQVDSASGVQPAGGMLPSASQAAGDAAAATAAWLASSKVQAAGGQLARPNARKMQTLSSSLQLLSHEDPDCLLIVRRINKLGFKAVRTLKRHFSVHGQVMKVLLAHSTVRQHGAPQCHARRRPSSLGFVQMATAEGAQKVFALGDEQEVEGVQIRVQRFERHRYAEMVAEEAEGAKEAEEGSDEGPASPKSTGPVKDDGEFYRQSSEASTTATEAVSSQGQTTAESSADSE